jgi:Flp pilus assembly protein TadD
VKRVIAPLIFLIAFSLYLKTYVAETSTADSGELISAAFLLGIPHPTGYSSYCVISKTLITLLPIGTIALRSAMLSVLFGALSVAMLYILVRRIFDESSAVASSLLFGVSLTFWSQCVIQEVYSLHVFLLLMALLAGESLYRKFSDRKLYLFVFLILFSTAHHLLAVMTYPAWIYLLLGKKIRPALNIRNLSLSVVFGLIGLSTLLYFPIRSRDWCAMRWMDMDNWSGFIFHISGEQFRPIMFHLKWAEFIGNFEKFIGKLSLQWTSGILALAVIGLIGIARRRFRLSFFLCIYLAVLVYFVLNYRIIDIEIYYIQAYLPIAIMLGCGFSTVISAISFKRWNSVKAMLGLVFLSVILLMTIVRHYFVNDHSRNWIVYDYGVNIFNNLPLDSVLVTQGWSSPFVFSYFEHVLFYRPDIKVFVDYKGSTLVNAWRERWEIPVCTTVPIDVPGLERVVYKPLGITYWLDLGYPESMNPQNCWDFIRKRGMDDSSLFKDFHNQSLIAEYYAFLGEWSFSRGKSEDAQEYFKIVERMAVGNNLILNNLSGIYLKHEMYHEAERLARKSLNLDGRFFNAHHNLGNALMKLERYAEAIREFELCDDERVIRGRSHQALGYSYIKKGEFRKAADELKTALRFNPESAELKMNLAVACMNSKRTEEAEALLKQIVAMNPESPDIHNNMALLRMMQDRYDEAEDELRLALKYAPDYVDALVNLAIAEARFNHMESTEDLLVKAQKLAPSNTSVLNNLGLLYFKTDRKDDAIRIWLKSLQLDGEQIHIGENLRSAGCGEAEIRKYLKPGRVVNVE